MREHLSAQQLDLYGARRLPSAERWAIDEHLAACPACRERAAGASRAGERFASLLNDFERIVDSPLEHPDFEQIAGFVDDAMNESERAVVADHLSVCASCVEEVRELRSFRLSLATPPSIEHEATARRRTPTATSGERPGIFARLFAFPHWASPLTAGAAALVLIVAAGLFWLSRRGDAPAAHTEVARNESPSAGAEAPARQTPARNGEAATSERSSGAEVGGAPETSNRTSDAVDSSKPPEKNRDDASRTKRGGAPTSPALTPPATIVIAFNDGGRRVALDAAGNLEGLNQLPESDRRAVISALASGRVSTPPALAGLQAGGGPLLGGGGAGSGVAAFAPVSPVGTFVQTERPVFKWRALEGATSYLVNVFDASFNKVATSGALSSAEWTPPAGAFARGQVYFWQVTASRGGEEFTAPAPDAPEARFKVLDETKARGLDAAQRAAGNSHLALGVIYAREGLLDESEREFRLLLEENSKSSSAQKLLRDVRARRPGARR